MLCIKLVNMQNFKLLTFLLLAIWHHENIPSRREQVIKIRYLPDETEENFLKNYFLSLKTSFLAQNFTILFISLVFKWNKKFVCLIVPDVSFQKQLQQPPWWIDFAKMLPKCA